MREFLNAIRNLFFTNIIGEITLYSLISSIVKFIFVFIVLYYIYIIVKLIILDIKNIDFEKHKVNYYLSIEQNGKLLETKLLENYMTLGRNKSNDISLPNDLVSGAHAEIVKSDSSYYLIDRGSLNGTFLNGERLYDNLELFEGDVIGIGPYKIMIKKGDLDVYNKERGL